MLMRALATLTMLLALTAGTEPMPRAAVPDRAGPPAGPSWSTTSKAAASRRRPAVPVAPASCTEEGQP